MIVKTVGSDLKCNVVINDPSVSPFHLQLVRRDDGMMSVIDMGSEEGTSVNGNQIDREIILHAGDIVKAGQVDVDWEKHLVEKKKGKIGKGILFGILALLVMSVLSFLVMALMDNWRQKTVSYEGVYPQSEHVSFFDNGKQYKAEVVKGQVVLIFDPSVTHEQVVQSVEAQGATLCAQVPKFRYYLAQIEDGKEASLLDSIERSGKVIYAGRNFVHDFKTPKVAFLERYENIPNKMSHGEMVRRLITEGGGRASVSIENKDAIYGMNSASILEFCAVELHRSSNKQLLLFNMSFGPQVPSAKSWDEMSESDRSNYRYLTYKELDCLIALASNSEYDNFLFVKAMGNEGISSFDEVILDDYIAGLDEKNKKIFDSHFVLVGASDSRFHVNRPNAVSNQCAYHHMVTVELSSMESVYKGTSAATALMTGWLSGLSDRFGLTASECLAVIASVTDDAANAGHKVCLERLEEKCKTMYPSREEKDRLDREPKHLHKETKKNNIKVV